MTTKRTLDDLSEIKGPLYKDFSNTSLSDEAIDDLVDFIEASIKPTTETKPIQKPEP